MAASTVGTAPLAVLALRRTATSTAPRAQRILVFDRGRLVEHGSHGELLANGGVYAGLYASWLDATTANDGLPVPLG